MLGIQVKEESGSIIISWQLSRVEIQKHEILCYDGKGCNKNK